MILGLHGLFYISDAEATRAFTRDKLKLPVSDVGDGWLIFHLPQADVGVHQIDNERNPPPGTHDVSFYSNDIRGTVADLQSLVSPSRERSKIMDRDLWHISQCQVESKCNSTSRSTGRKSLLKEFIKGRRREAHRRIEDLNDNLNDY